MPTPKASKTSATATWGRIEVSKAGDPFGATVLSDQVATVDSHYFCLGEGAQRSIRAKKVRQLVVEKEQGSLALPGRRLPDSVLTLTVVSDKVTYQLSDLVYPREWAPFLSCLKSFAKTARVVLNKKGFDEEDSSEPKNPRNTFQATNRAHARTKVVPTSPDKGTAFIHATKQTRFSPNRQGPRNRRAATVRRQTFGRQGASSQSPIRRPKNSSVNDAWDDVLNDHQDNTASNTTTDGLSLSSPSQIASTKESAPIHLSSSPTGEAAKTWTHSQLDSEEEEPPSALLLESDEKDDEDGEDDEEMLFVQKPQTKPKRRRAVEESEDDDDIAHNSSAVRPGKTTTTTMTPLARSPSRVSPASRTNKKLAKKSVQRSFSSHATSNVTTATTTTTTPRESDGKNKSQQALDAFFQPRETKTTSFEPSKRAQNHQQATDQDAVATASPKKTTPKRKPLSQRSGGWVSKGSAGMTSPIRKRQHSLFGHSTPTKKASTRRTPPIPTQEEEDPIEEFSSPSRRPQPLDALDLADRQEEKAGAHSSFNAILASKSIPRRKKRKPIKTPLDLSSSKRLLPLNLAATTNDADDNTQETTFFRNPWRGLRNLGNTCYMNASIQMLATLASTAAGRTNWWENFQGKAGPLTESCLKVLKELMQPPDPYTRSVVNPTAVKKAIDASTDSFAGFSQHDAHEFLSYLIDTLQEEFASESKKTTADTVPKDVVDAKASKNNVADDFQCTIELSLMCTSCGYTRKRQEIFRHLSLDITNDEMDHASIPASLNRFFEDTEVELRCEKCTEGTCAIQTQRIVSSPKYLLLHLKRFILKEQPVPTGPENDSPNEASSRPSVEYVFVKNKAKVKIEEEVSLSRFCIESSTEFSEPNFHLRALIHHHGRLSTSGHYTADSVRPYRAVPNEGTVDLTKDTRTEQPNDVDDSHPDEEWIVFDDGNSCKKTLKEIQDSKSKQETAYVLLYAAQP